jgi:hypothetical protein
MEMGLMRTSLRHRTDTGMPSRLIQYDPKEPFRLPDLADDLYIVFVAGPLVRSGSCVVGSAGDVEAMAGMLKLWLQRFLKHQVH